MPVYTVPETASVKVTFTPVPLKWEPKTENNTSELLFSGSLSSPLPLSSLMEFTTGVGTGAGIEVTFGVTVGIPVGVGVGGACAGVAVEVITGVTVTGMPVGVRVAPEVGVADIKIWLSLPQEIIKDKSRIKNITYNIEVYLIYITSPVLLYFFTEMSINYTYTLLVTRDGRKPFLHAYAQVSNYRNINNTEGIYILYIKYKKKQ